MKKQFTILMALVFILIPMISEAKINDTQIKSVVEIFIYDVFSKEYVSSGSGINLSILDSPSILTNYHVVEDAIKRPDVYRIIVCTNENSQSGTECNFMASAYHVFGGWPTKARYSEKLDLALIGINWKKEDDGSWKSIFEMPISEWPQFGNVISVVPYGYDLTGVELGDEIQTLGFPDYANDALAYSKGVISSFWMDDGSVFNGYHGVLAILTNALISHGSSGGAAFDKNGKFLGITSAGITDDNNNFMAGVIIPVTTVNRWLKRLGYPMDKDGNDAVIRDEKEIMWEKVSCQLKDFAHYDEKKQQCVCNDWYEENDSGNCVSIPLDRKHQICEDKYGENYLYDIIDKKCRCELGYTDIGGQCVTRDKFCSAQYGLNSYSSKFDLFRWRCVTDSQEQPTANIVKDNGFMECSDLVNGYRGSNNFCYCNTGYKWNSEAKSCTKINNVKIDIGLINKVKGKILLQVEKNGEGWYVNPDNEKKYYLGRPADAFSIMRNLGLGIKHSELNNYLNSKFPSRLSGKILLDVERNGEAYYVNPDDLKGYYLNRPADAFRVMRELGLGITNNDIRKIGVGEIE